ncbi:MAG: hypothetical protein EVA89_11000 [Sandaracinaceae bacterium]|nr:MAG: hypothetical protein EVA89_11000 [Sandaracinaceae bacterium]
MRIFTNGKLTVLLTPSHVYRWPRRGEPSVVKKKSPGATDMDESGVLLVSSKGEDLTSAFAPHYDEATVLDAGLIDDARAAFLHGDQTLTWGPPPSDDWAQRVDVSKHRSEFPGWAAAHRIGPFGVRDDLDEEEQAYEQERIDARGVGFPHGILLANAHGIGIASNFSGNVALFRPDETEPSVAFRLGLAEEDRVYARPTKDGLLVTVVFNGRFSLLLRVDAKGKLRAAVPEQQGGRTPALEMGRLVLDIVDTKAVVRDAKLAELSSSDVVMRPMTAAASADGRHFAIADSFGGDLALYAVSAKGAIKEIDRISYADLQRQAKAEADLADAPPFDPERMTGTPSIGFAMKPVVSPPWTLAPGRFELPLIVRSAGGEGRGVAIRLSGAALDEVKLDRVTLGDESAAFAPDGDGQRAELPSATLLADLVRPIDPPPTNDQREIVGQLLGETHLELVVHGHAEKPSNAMLRVEVSALGATSSPLKWMRPLVVKA